MTILEELNQPSISMSFHPFQKNSVGLSILQRRLRELKDSKIKDSELFSSLETETISFCREIFQGKPAGLAMDILYCPSCTAKFLTFYASVLGISKDRNFISEVLEESNVLQST